jgi:hypothetical protein
MKQNETLVSGGQASAAKAQRFPAYDLSLTAIQIKCMLDQHLDAIA